MKLRNKVYSSRIFCHLPKRPPNIEAHHVQPEEARQKREVNDEGWNREINSVSKSNYIEVQESLAVIIRPWKLHCIFFRCIGNSWKKVAINVTSAYLYQIKRYLSLEIRVFRKGSIRKRRIYVDVFISKRFVVFLLNSRRKFEY